MNIKDKLRYYAGEPEQQTAVTFSSMAREAVKEIVNRDREIVELKDNAIDLNMEIITLKAHIKDSRDLTDKDLIASLRHDINVRNQQLLTAGQTIKTREDRIAYLEGKLKTAKADGIREGIESCRYPTASMNGGVDIDELIEYADQLEADNEQD